MECAKMNYYFTGILIVLLCLIAWMGPAYPRMDNNTTLKEPPKGYTLPLPKPKK